MPSYIDIISVIANIDTQSIENIMIIRRNKDKKFIIDTIDLMGQAGDAYRLLGYAAQLGKSLGWDKEVLKSIYDDMTSSDYNHLVAVFEINFGDYVKLEADEELLIPIVEELYRLNTLRKE